MDTSKSVSFQLDDAEGNAHQYEMYYHPAGDGFRISVELVQALGEPLLRALGDFADIAQEAVSAAAEGSAEAMEGLLDGVDLGAAMGALRSLDPDTLVDLGKRLLCKSTRDGAWVKGHAFDKAYQGNYTEMYSALWRIIEANRFIPFLGTLSGSPAGE